MAEVMSNLGNNEVTFFKNPQTPSTGGSTLTVKDYPLANKHPDMVVSNTGKPLTKLTFDNVKRGELSADDFKISPGTLELQAQIADADGRQSLGRNLRRAAELIAVPDNRLLEIYNALRPYRSSKSELLEIADELETQYHATVSAGFVREAADVYEKRGRLRED